METAPSIGSWSTDPVVDLTEIAARAVELVGRDRECGAIDALIASAIAEHAGPLVVRGAAGIGKSALLDRAVVAADRSDPPMRVLRLAGVETEIEMPYAGLHRILLPFHGDLHQLPVPQRAALDSAFGHSTDVAPSPFLVGLATLTLLTDSAARRPLMCVVDDAQWLDRESAECLAFVARRLHADQVVMLFAVRDPSPHLVAFDGLAQLELGPLVDAGAQQLLSSVVDQIDEMGAVDAAVAGRILAEAAGNPLAIIELVRELSPGQLHGAEPLPRDLPISARLEACFLRQARRLPAPAQLLLLTASAASSADPGVVRDAATTLGLRWDGPARAAVDELVVLHPEIRFRHPLVRSAIYEGASFEDHRRVHVALAAAFDRDGQPDRGAWHRAAASDGADETIADELERVASRARSRGGPSAEAALLARSAELTVDPHRRSARWMAAADAALGGGDLASARAALEHVATTFDDPLLEGQVHRLVGTLLVQRAEHLEAMAAFLAASALLEPVDPVLARDTLLDALHVVVVTRIVARPDLGDERAVAELEARLATRDPTRRLASAPGNDFLDGFAARFTVGHPRAVASLRAAIDPARHREMTDPEILRLGLLGFFAGLDLWDDEALRAWIQTFVGTARTRFAVHDLRIALMCAATVHVLFGEFAQAEACHVEHNELTAVIGGHVDYYRMHELELAAWRGREEETIATCAALTPPAEQTSSGAGTLSYVADNALLTLHLGFGRYAEALPSARTLYLNDPPRYGCTALPDVIEAAFRGGDGDLAEEALRRLSERADAADTAWAAGVLARCRALVAGDAAEPFHLEAVRLLATTRATTDLARAHLVYGEWLRRQKRRSDARVHLRQALHLFDQMGAQGYAERSRAELAATGERARKRTVEGHDVLTPQETQVARRAAAHATNREIAAELFVSVSTIEYHLHHVFQKLQISSRRELAAVLPATDGTGVVVEVGG